MGSGSSGSRLGSGHVNLKVHTAFLAFPVPCTKLQWYLPACIVDLMKSESMCTVCDKHRRANTILRKLLFHEENY